MLDFLKAVEENTIPTANVLEGHRSTASCILANIAMKLERPLEYDPELRIVKNDSEATLLLQRPYRSGWKHPFPEDFSLEKWTLKILDFRELAVPLLTIHPQ